MTEALVLDPLVEKQPPWIELRLLDPQKDHVQREAKLLFGRLAANTRVDFYGKNGEEYVRTAAKPTDQIDFEALNGAMRHVASLVLQRQTDGLEVSSEDLGSARRLIKFGLAAPALDFVIVGQAGRDYDPEMKVKQKRIPSTPIVFQDAHAPSAILAQPQQK